jgi:predicted nuclease with TOPRIM domain
LLIQIGIRALDGLKTTLIITSLIGAGISTLSFVPKIKNLIDSGKHKRLLKESNEKKQNAFEEYSKDSLNPNKTRDRLATLKQNNTDLTEIVEKCLNQMDRMDSIQDRYTTLIQANDATYLNDTISAINDTETRLCHNINYW